MKLFAIYIGGEHPKANIEVHDIRFIVAPSIKDTHDQLRADWWGTPGTLHIDCFAEIAQVDGHDVTLSPERPKGRDRLWFVNLGGYDGKDFAELHKNMFVVAPNISEAKAKALATVQNWTDLHRDDLYDADDIFSLDEIVGGRMGAGRGGNVPGERLHIHLTPSADPRPLRFTCRYTPLK